MKAAMVVATVLVTLGLARVASAYPQFTLEGAQTCADCHVAPAGGGLLNEMGRLFAEDLSRGEGVEEFLHGKWTPPEWLHLSGDVRMAAGITGRGDYGPAIHPAVVPMQAEINASVDLGGGVSLAATGGLRGAPAQGNALSLLHLREHYVMWRPSSDGRGVYARAGHFMAPYGLRFAEHPAYTRRYSGTNLFSEIYGASIGWVGGQNEVHVTGFVHDFLRDENAEPGDGAALYAEHRLASKAAVGVSARYADSHDDTRSQVGVTGKAFLSGPAVLLQLQVDGIQQNIAAGPSREQLAAYLMASHRTGPWMLSVGLGHYDEDLAVKDLDRDAVDLNLHLFPWAHWEFALTTRAQVIGQGDGGALYGYALLQAHYRL